MTATLIDTLHDYIRIKGVKPSTAAGYQAIVRRCFGDWLDKPMDQITPKMVVDRHVEMSKTAPAQSNQAMRVLRAVYHFVNVQEEDEPGFVPLRNPVLKLNRHKIWNKIHRRQGRIAIKHLSAFWYAVESMRNSTHRNWLKVLFLTGLRRNEVAMLKWEDVDMREKTFTVNGKAGHPCVVPMSTHVLRIFAELQFDKNGPYVFPGRFPDTHMDKTSKCYEEVELSAGLAFCPHDLRRGFMSTAQELHVQPWTIKKMLTHSDEVSVSGDVTYGYYVPDMEKLRGVFQQVADELMRQAGAEERVKA